MTTDDEAQAMPDARAGWVKRVLIGGTFVLLVVLSAVASEALFAPYHETGPPPCTPELSGTWTRHLGFLDDEGTSMLVGVLKSHGWQMVVRGVCA